jgi:hypothetical protein
VQLWTMTISFDTNHPNIRYWPWASSFKVTEQNYFSIYFSIILPISTHCQPILYSVKPVKEGQWIAAAQLCRKMCLLLGIYSESQYNIICNG